MLPKEAYWTLVILITLLAFVKGRREEWSVMAIIVIGTILTRFAHQHSIGQWDSVEIGVLLVDAAAFLALCGVALFTRRFWPMWVAGLQLASSSSHLLRFVTSDLPPWIYYAAESFWIYPMLAAVVVGTLRVKRYWPDEYRVSEPQPA